MDLSNLRVYRRAMDVGDVLWEEVSRWDGFAKYTLGEQLVESADSIAANLSEGNGRFHYAENRQFCYYARGSLEETKTWIDKAVSRGLIAPEQHQSIRAELDVIGRMLNAYIRSIGPQ